MSVGIVISSALILSTRYAKAKSTANLEIWWRYLRGDSMLALAKVWAQVLANMSNKNGNLKNFRIR